MTPREIKERLLDRGVDLNPGSAESDIQVWQSKYDFPIDPFWTAIFREFDGFSDAFMDPDTLFRIWTVQEMIEFNLKNTLSEKLFVFGDYSIRADFLLGDLSDASAPVILSEEPWEWAPSAPQFWEDYVSGKFD